MNSDTLSMASRNAPWACTKGERIASMLSSPSRETAERWYNSAEYQAIIRHRLDNSSGDMIMVDGYDK